MPLTAFPSAVVIFLDKIFCISRSEILYDPISSCIADTVFPSLLIDLSTTINDFCVNCKLQKKVPKTGTFQKKFQKLGHLLKKRFQKLGHFYKKGSKNWDIIFKKNFYKKKVPKTGTFYVIVINVRYKELIIMK